MSYDVAASRFPEAKLRSHHRTSANSHADSNVKNNGYSTGSKEKRGETGAILRATGDVLIPGAVSRHVEFISGLTELWVSDVGGGGSATGKLRGVKGRSRGLLKWDEVRGCPQTVAVRAV